MHEKTFKKLSKKEVTMKKKLPTIYVKKVLIFRSQNVFKIDAKIVNGRFKAARGAARSH